MTHKNTAITLLLTICLFFLGALCFDVTYCLNDDLMIQSILSGTFAAENSGLAVYFNAPLSHVLALFYGILPTVPWLGLFLCSCFILCFALVLHRLFSMQETVMGQILVFLLVPLGFGALFFFQYILIHYTVVAAVTGATGAFLLATAPHKNTWKQTILSMLPAICLLLLCFLIRTNVFILILPFVLCAFLMRLCYTDKNSESEKPDEDNKNSHSPFYKKLWQTFINHLPAMGIFFGGAAFLFSLHFLLYQTGEMKTYTEYNDARTTLYDYEQIHDTPDARAYYASKGVTEEEVNIYLDYNILLDETSSPEKFLSMASYKKDAGLELSPVNKLKNAFSTYKIRTLQKNADYPYNFMALGLYALSFAAILLRKKYAFFIPLGAMGVLRSLLFVYLFYQGRYPERVTLSVYLAECILFAALFALLLKENKSKTILSAVGTVLALLFLAMLPVTASMGITAYNNQQEINKSQNVLFAYMQEHPDNLYLADVYATVYRTEPAIADYDSSYENYITLGGWISGHPLLDKKLALHGYSNIKDALTTGEDVYLVLHESKGMTGEEFTSYYPEITLTLYETVEGANDRFYIYKPSLK